MGCSSLRTAILEDTIGYKMVFPPITFNTAQKWIISEETLAIIGEKPSLFSILSLIHFFIICHIRVKKQIIIHELKYL